MKKYLVIYDPNTGFAELANVGIFEADNEKSAIEAARMHWNTAGKLVAYDLDSLQDCWSFYE